MDSKNDDIKYAPVIIPTLCRFDHFKSCIESLMNCTHADKTDVYIGLDYPSKNEHWGGYRKICEYLDDLNNHHRFKNLYVIKREKNYGLGINGNYFLLRKQVLTKHDTFIASEDDNIFGKAFLDYCNKGLIKFRNDKAVLAICGYRSYYPFRFGENTYAKQRIDFAAWGYASWKDRIDTLESLTPSWFRKRLSVLKFINFCKTNGNNKALYWLQYALRPKNRFVMYDDGISVYMGLEGKHTIMPAISLVKNIGLDGSGWHFKNNRIDLMDRMQKQEIDQAPVFSFIGSGDEFYNENMVTNINNSYNNISTKRLPIAIMKMFTNKFIAFIKIRK